MFPNQNSWEWKVQKTFSMNPLDQKTTMKTKNMFWAMLSMTAALMMTACSSNEFEITETPDTSTTVKTIPYTVTVSGATPSTRATVADDPSDPTNYHKTLYFAEGDKLYISGTNIQGVLSIESGVGGTNGTFKGNLTYSGSGTGPENDLPLTATLVSAQQTVGTQVSVDEAGAVTVNYPTEAYCTDVAEAVQKYSKLKGNSIYGQPSFKLTQGTAFLSFVITFDDGTTSDTELSAKVINGSSALCTANVTTTTESGNIVAKFVLPVNANNTTTLNNATVQLGDKAAISFGASQTLEGKVYNVKRTYIHPGAISGKFSVGPTKQVYFSKGNLQATTSDKGTNWKWSFAPNQWEKVGANAANTTITENKKVSTEGTCTVDLFGWSTDETYLGIHKTDNNNTEYEGEFRDWGKNADVIADIGNGWYTLESDEWRYLIITRTTTSGKHYCKAQVNGVNGVILLPDDWSTSYYSLIECDITELNFDNNLPDKISLTDWNNSFVPHGAVFLPCAGQRNSGNVVNAPDGQVHCWSATATKNTTVSANNAYFIGTGVAPDAGAGRSNGFSVRLVRDVK